MKGLQFKPRHPAPRSLVPSDLITDSCVLSITVNIQGSWNRRPYLTIGMDLRTKCIVSFQVDLTPPACCAAPTPGKPMQPAPTEIWLRNLQRHVAQLANPIDLVSLEFAIRQYIELYNQIVTELSAA